MTASPRSTYIDTLDYDTLLHIFTMNANMFSYQDGDKALPTTWATSQVCQRWREMMLNTPSLWAKVIYIDSSGCCRGAEWWKELIRRTSTALLWIRVYDPFGFTRSTDGSRFTKVFTSILHENWTRIEKLEMDLSISDESQLPSWETFSRSAPVLETFDVTFSNMVPIWLPDFTLITPPFSGDARML